jgi:hypothetical protein
MARIYAEQLAAHLWQHMTNEDAAKPLAGPAKVDAAVTTIYAFECTEICRPAVVAVPTRKLNEASTSGYSAKGDMATTAYLLQRQGLLAVEAIEVPFFDDLINIELACLTGLGADFVVACMGRRWSMCGRGRKRQRSSTDLNSSHDPLGQEKPASRFVAPWPKINRRHRHQSAIARARIVDSSHCEAGLDFPIHSDLTNGSPKLHRSNDFIGFSESAASDAGLALC